MSLAVATAAPTIIKANGKEYRVKPLTLADLGALERWVQEDVMRLGREQAEQTTDRDTKVLFIEQAYAKAQAVNMLTNLNEYSKHIPFVVQLVFESLRYEHPTITTEEVSGLLLEEGSAQAFLTAATNFGLAPTGDDAKKKTA